jgi:hypothetical protein
MLAKRGEDSILMLANHVAPDTTHVARNAGCHKWQHDCLVSAESA